MELRTFLQELWSKGLLIIIGVAVTAGIVFFATNALPKTYEATTRLVVNAGLGGAGIDTDEVANAPRVARTYAVLAKTRPLLEVVIKDADLPYDPVEFAAALTVIADIDTPFLTIAVADGDPALAAKAANAVAAELIDRATDRSVAGSPPVEQLSVVEPALAPDEPISPRPVFNTALSATVVLLLVVLAIAVASYLRPAERTAAGARGG